jgi:hypothetical protein
VNGFDAQAVTLWAARDTVADVHRAVLTSPGAGTAYTAEALQAALDALDLAAIDLDVRGIDLVEPQ